MSSRYTLADLAREVGTSVRTLNVWVKKGALPRVKSRGPVTTYDEPYRARVLAVARLRREEHLGLPAVAERLARATDAEILHLAGLGPPPPVTPAAGAAQGGSTQRWERTCLYTGLELHLAEGADEAAQRMAQAIRTLFGPKPTS